MVAVGATTVTVCVGVTAVAVCIDQPRLCSSRSPSELTMDQGEEIRMGGKESRDSSVDTG